MITNAVRVEYFMYPSETFNQLGGRKLDSNVLGSFGNIIIQL